MLLPMSACTYLKTVGQFSWSANLAEIGSSFVVQATIRPKSLALLELDTYWNETQLLKESWISRMNGRLNGIRNSPHGGGDQSKVTV